MIDFELSIILGSILERIRNNLNQFDELYLGIFINSLTYKDQKAGNVEKKKYINSLRPKIGELNSQSRLFNKLLRKTFGTKHRFEKLPEISFSEIKKIILSHKGDYPETRGDFDLLNFKKELLGETDSASSLSRKHTALQIRNTIDPLRISIKRFMEGLNILKDPYEIFFNKEEKFRVELVNEIEKSFACYSINLRGEAVFIIGRILENLCHEWIKLLKKQKRFKGDKIPQERNTPFEAKINILYRLNVITPSQQSKLLSLKWDRNDFGHNNKNALKIEKDADITIRTGINLIILVEQKINHIKKSRKIRKQK